MGTQIAVGLAAGRTIVSTEIEIGFLDPAFRPFAQQASLELSVEGVGRGPGILVAVVEEYTELEYSLPSPVESVELPEEGSLHIKVKSGVPTQVYLSAPDGEELFHYRTITEDLVISGSSYSVDLFHPLERQFLYPLPPGDLLVGVFGRLISVRGSEMYVSEPFDPSAYDPQQGVLNFPDHISMVGVVGKTVFVGTSNELYFITGNGPEEWVLTCIHNIGVIAKSEVNTRMRLPNDEVDVDCLVFSLANGTTVAGFDGGGIRNLTEGEVLPGKLLVNGAHMMGSIYYFTH